MSEGYGYASIMIHPGREARVNVAIDAGPEARVRYYPRRGSMGGYVVIDQDRVSMRICLPDTDAEPPMDFLTELLEAVTSLVAECRPQSALPGPNETEAA
ncbi:hypothetical protein [Herbidospora sp. NBRC 101105]|uniref:hypothetical protein n=1 Tax=Herbidospora sp. NBRC 101105 TaxID=3032195 RepID=UPI0024A127D6|nr:hypothetical protein [Herbidospora sp. NBRC 101105]GLX95047.1 hypothetical protein Hesp01_29970 [Herbidospora sp. NBRC 101105]